MTCPCLRDDQLWVYPPQTETYQTNVSYIMKTFFPLKSKKNNMHINHFTLGVFLSVMLNFTLLHPRSWPSLLLSSVCRCLRSVRRGPCGGFAGEIPVCFRGVCEEPVSQPTQQVWEAPAAPALPTHRLFLCHRAALLRPSGGQNPHRNSNKGHAADREQLQLALYAHSIEEKPAVDL